MDKIRFFGLMYFSFINIPDNIYKTIFYNKLKKYIAEKITLVVGTP